MYYENIEPAVFLERPNRFIAWVETSGGWEICHVKNTGRCRELLLPGAALYVQRNNNPVRKTPLDLISVIKNGTLINMDSQAPNQVVREWLKEGGAAQLLGFCCQAEKKEEIPLVSEKSVKGLQLHAGKIAIRPEYRYGDSRVDFYIEGNREGIENRRMLLEVKGVTLEEDGIARFPDAPTERGVKHIRELTAALKEGYEACILFVIQMKGIKYLEPNDKTHPAFGEALREAKAAGVKVLAYDCSVTPELLVLDQPVEVRLGSRI